jgi:hypothetical protein
MQARSVVSSWLLFDSGAVTSCQQRSYLMCTDVISADMSVLKFPVYSFEQVFPSKAHAVIVGG